MIDIIDALDLVDSCVRDRGDNYRTGRRGPTRSHGRRYPACPAVTDSIVTLVFGQGRDATHGSQSGRKYVCRRCLRVG
jgi:hypothetical protein